MPQKDFLFEVLQELKPTGYEGFEGLILKLLEKLTGERFYLAKAGYQAGKDMSTRGINGTCIAVECKRYGKNSRLDERELLGELVQAHLENPALDLWVLVASTDIDSQLIQRLSQEGRNRGVEFFTIETLDGNPGSIEALCAYGDEIVLDFVQTNYSDRNKLEFKKLKSHLLGIKEKTGYKDRISFFKDSLSAFGIGYDSWRMEQNEWLLEQFGSESKSRFSFQQVIKVHGSDNTIIERKSTLEQLDNWLNRWKEDKRPFVLTGEEGDGKTWAVAHWLTKYIQLNNNSPVLFLPARHVISTDIERMLSDAITRQLKKHDAVFWAKKVQNWMKRPVKHMPVVILVIDGINEYYSLDWLAVLEQLKLEPWGDQIALVTTSRAAFWKKRFTSWSSKVYHWTLPSYDDNELNEALKKNSLSISDISCELNTLIRKPRYFDLVVKYRGKITESGDITVQRLIYEDIKDRVERINNRSLTNDDFEALICGLAEKAVSGKYLFKQKDFSDLLPLINEKTAIFEELMTSGIFIKDKIEKYKFKVEPSRLAHGLGIILLANISKIPTPDLEAVEECIAGFLEPQPDIDFKAEIVGSAVFHVMNDKNSSEVVRFGLLKYWINSVNLYIKHLEDFPAYFPCSPKTYFKLAEHSWAESNYNPMVQRSLKYTFLKWAEENKFLELFKLKFEEWMGYVSIYGRFSIKKDDEKKKAEKYREEMQRQLGCVLNLGPFLFLDFPLALKDNPMLLRLSDLVLSVISHLNAQPFIRAITIGVLTEIIARVSWGGISTRWILRMNKREIWSELEKEVLNLIEKNNTIAYKTAYRLLSYERSEKSLQLRCKLPQNLFEEEVVLGKHKNDPCKSFFLWEEGYYYNCLCRKDITLFQKTRDIKAIALKPDLPVPESFRKKLQRIKEEIEPSSIWTGGFGRNAKDSILEDCEVSLYAFSPGTIAEIIKSIIRDTVNRDRKDIFKVSIKAYKHYLILGIKEIAAIKKTWEKLREDEKFKNKFDQEEYYLFKIVLASSAPMIQLRMLIPKKNEGLFVGFEKLFKKLDATSWDEVLTLIQETNNNNLWKILWFISKYPKDIPKEILEKIEELMFHSDGFTRSEAIKIAYLSKDPNLIKTFIDSSWSSSKNNHHEENQWGSLLIAEFGCGLPYEKIRTRVMPSFLAYAISKKSMKTSEIEKYENDLKDSWFRSNPERELLKEIIRRKPDLVQKWIQFVLPNSYEKDWHLEHHRSFYNELCGMLLEINPEEGFQLYIRLKEAKKSGRITDAATGIETLTFDLYRAKESEFTKRLWDEAFENCYTDIGTIEIAIVNQMVDNLKWFQRKIEQYFSSDSLFEKARGINLMGFFDKEYARDKLTALKDEIPDCWLHPVIDTSINRWNRNNWAKTWFQRFLEHKDKIKAWAAFRLFLKCTDRRFWIWKNEIMEGFQETPFFKERDIFLELNRDTIKESIKKNEEKLKDTFLGSKIEKNIWPWM